MNQQNNASTAEAGPITPRCLSTVPSDLEEILKAFHRQGQEQQS